MSEKLRSANLESAAERSADRFRVDPANYPIFGEQIELDSRWGNNTFHRWNIDRTLSTFVTQTADLICRFDGTSKEYLQNPELAPPDHINYLDKSARPVSWLVNTFWDDFSDQKRPQHSYLSIDRLTWFQRSGVPVDVNGYTVSPDGSPKVATYTDFRPENLPESDFARIRGLYLPEWIEDEDPDKIMQTASSLDGKNIMVIDEVGRSGATLNIAIDLVRRAIPEAASVRGAYFWKSQSKSHNGEDQILSVPVWYNSKSSYGRGIGELDPKFYKDRYESQPNRKTHAQYYGSIVLSAFNNLRLEPGQRSRELMREIREMRQDYDAGRILLRIPDHYTDERGDAVVESQGLRLAPASDPAPDTYINVARALEQRPAH